MINDCGTRDNVLLLSQFFILFTGMAGRVGFYGFTGPTVINRYFHGGHSHYFEPADPDQDAFMRRWWVPVLTSNASVHAVDEFVTLGNLQGLWYASMRMANPIKLLAYFGLGGLIVYQAAILPRDLLQTEFTRREVAAATVQMRSNSSLADGVGTMMKIIESDAAAESDLRRQTILLARYGLQRLETRDIVLADIPFATVFRWNGSTWFRGTKLMELAGLEPRYQVSANESGQTLLVSTLRAEGEQPKTELRALHARDGTVMQLTRVSGELDGGASLKVQRLKTSKNRYLMSLSTSTPDEDGMSDWESLKAVDLDRLTARTIDEDDSYQVSSNCQSVAVIPEDKDYVFVGLMEELFHGKVKASSKKPVAAANGFSSIDLGSQGNRCFERIEPSKIPNLAFPRPIPEEALYKNVESPKPSTGTHVAECPPDDWDVELAEELWPIRHTIALGSIDTATIVSTDDPQGYAFAFNETQYAGFFSKKCPRYLLGADGMTFVATMIDLVSDEFGWAICRLLQGDTLSDCHFRPFPAYDQSGATWHQDGSDLVAFAHTRSRQHDTWQSPAGFELVSLSTGKVIEPDVSSLERILNIVTDQAERLLLVATAVANSQYGVEVFAYQIGQDELQLIGRRRFIPSEAAASVQEDVDNSPSSTANLLLVNGRFVLSMSPTTLIGLEVVKPTVPRLVSAVWAKLSALLNTPVTLPEAIKVSWLIPDTELGRVAKLWPASAEGIAMISAGTRARLILAHEGVLVTPVINFTTLKAGCGAEVRSADVHEDGSVIVTFPTCRFQRPAPPPASAVTESSLAVRMKLVAGQ